MPLRMRQVQVRPCEHPGAGASARGGLRPQCLRACRGDGACVGIEGSPWHSCGAAVLCGARRERARAGSSGSRAARGGAAPHHTGRVRVCRAAPAACAMDRLPSSGALAGTGEQCAQVRERRCARPPPLSVNAGGARCTFSGRGAAVAELVGRRNGPPWQGRRDSRTARRRPRGRADGLRGAIRVGRCSGSRSRRGRSAVGVRGGLSGGRRRQPAARCGSVRCRAGAGGASTGMTGSECSSCSQRGRARSDLAACAARRGERAGTGVAGDTGTRVGHLGGGTARPSQQGGRADC